MERHLLPSKVGAGQCPLHFASLEEAIDSPQKLTSLLRRHKWVAVQCRVAKGPYFAVAFRTSNNTMP